MQNVAKNCDFDDTKTDTILNQNIRDQFILGLQSDDLRRRLLAENDLTLERATKIALAYESSQLKSEVIKSKEVSPQDAPVLAYRSLTPSRSRNKEVHFSDGKRYFRPKSQSPARRKPICFFCNKPGHVQKNCFLKNKQKSKRDRNSLNAMLLLKTLIIVL